AFSILAPIAGAISRRSGRMGTRSGADRNGIRSEQQGINPRNLLHQLLNLVPSRDCSDETPRRSPPPASEPCACHALVFVGMSTEAPDRRGRACPRRRGHGTRGLREVRRRTQSRGLVVEIGEEWRSNRSISSPL